MLSPDKQEKPVLTDVSEDATKLSACFKRYEYTQVELDEALIDASKDGRTEVVRLLLDAGADVHAKEEENLDASLYYAAASGHAEVVEMLLKHGADASYQFERSWYYSNYPAPPNTDIQTPLCRAAEFGHTEVVRLLLSYGASVHVKDRFHDNISDGKVGLFGTYDPLCRASAAGHIEIVSLLLEYDANLHVSDEYPDAPIRLAARGGHVDIVRLLFDAGADINAEGIHGLGDPLQEAAYEGHPDVVTFLLEHGANSPEPMNRSLRFSALAGKIESVKLLVEEGANVHIEGDDGKDAALCNAASNGHVEVVSYLLDFVLDQESLDAALFNAARGGYLHTVKLLLKNGANASNPKHNTVTIATTAEKNIELVKLLLKHGANAGESDSSGLQCAAREGHLDLCKILLEYGADLNAVDSNGNDSISIAKEKGHKELTSFLRLSAKILDCDEKKDRRDKLPILCGIEDANLKDAFEAKGKPRPPIVRMALHAASIATVLSAGENELRDAYFKTLMRSDFVYINKDRKIKCNWYADRLDTKLKEVERLRDIIYEVAEVVLLPILARERFGPEKAGELSDEDVDALLLEATRNIPEMILDDKVTLDFAKLIDRGTKIELKPPDHLRPFRAVGKWYPFFEGEIDLGDGLTITPLTSHDHLVVEGEALQHCLGRRGYGTNAQRGLDHIFAIRENGISIATLILEKGEKGDIETPDGSSWFPKVYKGFENLELLPSKTDPNSENPIVKKSKKAWEKFVEIANSGEITLARRHGLTTDAKKVFERLSAVARRTGFEIHDIPESVGGFLAHYKEEVSDKRKYSGKKASIFSNAMYDEFEKRAYPYLKDITHDPGRLREALRKFHYEGSDFDEALLVCAEDGNLESALELIKRGANIHAEDIDGENTPLRIAERSGYEDLCTFLRLATRIIDFGESVNPQKELLSFCEIDEPLSDSSAFNADTWREHPVVRIALNAAAASSVLSSGDVTLCNEYFKTLIENDVSRINKTEGLSLGRYAVDLNRGVRGVTGLEGLLNEVAESVYFPLLVRNELKRIGSKELSDDKVEEFLRKAKVLAAREVTSSRTTSDLLTIRKKWEEPSVLKPLELRPYYGLRKWYPLFEGELDLGNDLSIIALSSQSDLREESKALDYLIGLGDHEAMCQRGASHILSVRKKGVPIATITLQRARDGIIQTPNEVKWGKKEFAGPTNIEPSREANSAWAKFVGRVIEEKVKLTEKHGVIEEEQGNDSFLTNITRISGFELSEIRDQLPRILNYYHEAFSLYLPLKQSMVPLAEPLPRRRSVRYQRWSDAWS